MLDSFTQPCNNEGMPAATKTKMTPAAFKSKAEAMIALRNPGDLAFKWEKVLPYAPCKSEPGTAARTGFVVVTAPGYTYKRMVATHFTDGTFSVR